MTAQEKAQELFDKYKEIKHSVSIPLNKKRTKQCALIAVDEIIKSNPTNPLKGSYIELYSDMIDDAISYWQAVKHEIQNL